MSLQKYHVLVMIVACGLLSSCSMTRSAATYDTPEAALQALEDAVTSRSVAKADEVFGSEGDYILHTGEAALDKQRGQAFVSLFEQGHRLEPQADGSLLLVLGKKSWPFPVPLIKTGSGWQFDAAAGEEQLLTRIIGRNELSAIEVSRTIYFAQKMYSSTDWDGDGRYEYADRIISTPGQRDGLYWPVEVDEHASPLGPVIAKATDEIYTINPDGAPQPYRGYYFKVVATEPPANADGDARSRKGGYWLISTPAKWGTSGVMTFASNERGSIYEKDFGESGTPLESSLGTIDESWKRVE